MNIILIDLPPNTHSFSLKHNDPRAQHIKTVLKIKEGQTCFIGIPQGAMGRAMLKTITPSELIFSLQWESQAPAKLYPISLLIGLPRPQTARKVIHTASSLGVEKICFFRADKGERSYAQSSLWSTQEWQQQLIHGAEQAFTTSFPKLVHFSNLEAAIEELGPIQCRLALDIYESDYSLGQVPFSELPIALGIGPERGWSDAERRALRTGGFQLTHLGPRILRTEIACSAAIGILLSRLAW